MRKKTYGIVITGMAAVAGLAITSVAELLRYSPYEDPGALAAGTWLGLAAVGLAAVMLIALGGSAVIRAARAYRQWRRQLTPGARIAADMAEIAAMSYAHEAWSRHNREVSARLARSVMGDNGDGPE